MRGRVAGRVASPRMREAIASIAVVPVLGLVLVLTSLSAVAIVDGLDHGAPPGGVPAGHLAAH